MKPSFVEIAIILLILGILGLTAWLLVFAPCPKLYFLPVAQVPARCFNLTSEAP